jgi:hypothetical protein
VGVSGNKEQMEWQKGILKEMLAKILKNYQVEKTH